MLSLATLGAGTAHAQPAPGPFVSQLDLLCYPVSSQHTLPVQLQLKHLNPLFADLPVEPAATGALREVCVPVYKDNAQPPTDLRNYLQFVDLACYDLAGRNLDRKLNLYHLNPVVRQKLAPDTGEPAPENVDVREPTRLCLPVQKLPPPGVPPVEIPPQVLQLVQWIDLACYRIEPPAPVAINLVLQHLNPLIRNFFQGSPPPTGVSNLLPRDLCVPVAKGDPLGGPPVLPPPEFLPIVQEIDIKRYDIGFTGQQPPFNFGPMTLAHLNPLLAGVQTDSVYLQSAQPLILGLPVRKENGGEPPSSGGMTSQVPLLPWPAVLVLLGGLAASGMLLARRRK